RLEITDIKTGEGFAIGKSQITNTYFDYKNGIFVFRGNIGTDENDKTLALAKWSIQSRTYTRFMKLIKFNFGYRESNEISIPRYFRFIGYCENYYERYDDKGNMHFEIVICTRKTFYRGDIVIRRKNEYLLIAKVEKPIKLTMPLMRKNKKKKSISIQNLRVGNTFWSLAGIIIGTIGIATAATPGVLALSVIYGGNAIISSVYSIGLDITENDDRLNAEDFLNNPLRWTIAEIFGELFKIATPFTEKSGKNLGKGVYYASELYLGYSGFKNIGKEIKAAKGINKFFFKLKTKQVNLGVNGIYELGENEIRVGRSIYYSYQTVIGSKGIYDNGKGMIKEGTELVNQPIMKVGE
ncbi:MAG: hypothetical protein PWP46_1641, partial [Fusobacteriaceae bacterium]|nr:hypothetical protein [Fusobacteriaceae bacterium]